MTRLLLLACLAPACLALSACGRERTVHVVSEPPDAACTLQAGSRIFPVPASGVLQVDRDAAPLAAECRRPGYRPTRVLAGPQDPGLLAGPLRPALSPATPADNDVPRTIRVPMPLCQDVGCAP